MSLPSNVQAFRYVTKRVSTMKHDRFLANNLHYIKYLVNTHSCEYFPHTKYFTLKLINFSNPGRFTKGFHGTLVSYTHCSNQVRSHMFREVGLSVLLRSGLKCGLFQVRCHTNRTLRDIKSHHRNVSPSDQIKQEVPVGNE